MNKPLIKKENNSIELREMDLLNPIVSMEDKIKLGTTVANQLKPIIENQNLSVSLKAGQPEYVTVEGWNTLGTILGCKPIVEDVTMISDKPLTYKAKVSIMQGDSVLSTAFAIAYKNNKQREPEAVFSMAQTRATGKAYRLCLSWIMKLAGYSPTPAEEMENFEEISRKEAFERAKSKTLKKKTIDVTKKEE